MRIRLEAANAARDVVEGRLEHTEGTADVTVALGDATLLPGLVNAHDHLHRNHVPRLGTPPYASAGAWGDDLHARFADDLARRHMLPRRDALLFGALKNVLGGVTTVVHHDSWEPDFERNFPLRVARIPAVQSLNELRGVPATGPWMLHLAEGTDERSAAEIGDAHTRGLLSSRLLAVHLVGANREGIALLAEAGCAAVWCPTSNSFLYGATAPRALFEAPIDVLLGTDALVSGDGTLLKELRVARQFGFLSDERLEAAVTTTAARRLSLPIPSLDEGANADVVALEAPLLGARPRDVVLVLVAGRPVLADELHVEIFEAAGIPHEPLSVGGRLKHVIAPLARVARDAFALSPEATRILD